MEHIHCTEYTENISCKLTTNPIEFWQRLEEEYSTSAQRGMLRAVSAAPAACKTRASDTNNVRNVAEDGEGGRDGEWGPTLQSGAGKMPQDITGPVCVW